MLTNESLVTPSPQDPHQFCHPGSTLTYMRRYMGASAEVLMCEEGTSHGQKATCMFPVQHLVTSQHTHNHSQTEPHHSLSHTCLLTVRIKMLMHWSGCAHTHTSQRGRQNTVTLLHSGTSQPSWWALHLLPKVTSSQQS